jgi:DNA-binding transcriptional MocR family regulator
MLRLRVPSQPTLRPFDVAVALRLLLEPEDRYEPLADALATSTSAVHRSVARLQSSGLLRAGRRTVARAALREFLLHGVRYAFPPVRGPEVIGLPTAWAHGTISALLQRDPDFAAERPLVWPAETGGARGDLLVPLFPSMARVAQLDPRLHELLAAVDALRAGSPPVRRVVSEYLAERVLWGGEGADG